MALTIILGSLTGISLALGLWQLVVGLKFPLHRRNAVTTFTPPISILKPLKGCDTQTSDCLRSWLTQRYAGSFEILFGVGSIDDPVCNVVRKLIAEHPHVAARLVVCTDRLGVNPKVSQLAQLGREARHEMICVSDADVFAPPDFLANTVQRFSDTGVGLVSALYRFAGAPSLEMKVEALSVNADFWSQVLQARSLAPMRFALGAALMLPRQKLDAIGGFAVLSDYLADDYQLGQRVSGTGSRLELGTVVVECRSPRLTPREVWAHQVRWARTIRACRPWAYCFSLLGNPLVWPALWVCLQPIPLAQVSAAVCLAFRALAAGLLERKMTRRASFETCCIALLKDFLQVAVWVSAFTGRRVTWRGRHYGVASGGKLAALQSEAAAKSVPARPPVKKIAGAARREELRLLALCVPPLPGNHPEQNDPIRTSAAADSNTRLL